MKIIVNLRLKLNMMMNLPMAAVCLEGIRANFEEDETLYLLEKK